MEAQHQDGCCINRLYAHDQLLVCYERNMCSTHCGVHMISVSDYLVDRLLRAHANANTVYNVMQPDAGRIQAYRSPGGPGIRLDGAMMAGNQVSRFYDSLLVKACALTKATAAVLARLAPALYHTIDACLYLPEPAARSHNVEPQGNLFDTVVEVKAWVAPALFVLA